MKLAARLDLRIIEIPVQYREWTYGITQMNWFRHDLRLLKMTFFALRRIKFV